MPLAFFNIDFNPADAHLGHIALFIVFMIVATLIVSGFSMVTRYRG